MADEGLAVFDLDHCIATGDMIERQRDRDTGQWKYQIRGEAADGMAIEVVVRLGPTGKVVFVTVYTA